jgi:hypothetical protein
MGIGRVLGAVAPIAAGYFGGPALAGAFGSATGGAIAAGALTGAGIAALSNQDILGGAFTGGLGGLSGGAMGTAAQATKAAEALKLAQAGAPTASINSALYGSAQNISPFTPTGVAGVQTATPGLTGSQTVLGQAGQQAMAQSAPLYQGAQSMMGQSGVSNAIMTNPTVAGGGGYNPSAFGRGVEGAQAAFREPGEFLSQLGKGSKAMGAGKLGLTGLGVAGQAGAFDPEPIKLSDSRDKYDPNARLNLSMDTGIGGSLRRDTGLRLLAQGGMVNNYANGGPAMYGMTPAAPPPKYGIIDVGGKFVETSKEPGPGLISDSDFKEQYQTTTAEKNQQGGGGGGMDPNLAPGGQGADDKGMNSGAISALAAGFAQQQTNPPTKSQTLGLEALAGGGYLETGGEVGDGMSDEIEATIEGEQEARLSDGEFVIPADVVSHLGNGSSDAGAKRLYEMMDKVRMARTGTKKQGKEINPERYMPA